MLICVGISLLLVGTYAYTMFWYARTWNAVPDFEPPTDFQPQTSITVLIPARDEAENIGSCLRSIFQNQYPAELLQVIVLDDHSADATAEIAQSTGAEVVKLAQHPPPPGTVGFKKHAITTGIGFARGELIVCTDADCLVPPKWLFLLAAAHETKRADFIAAPVAFTKEQSAFQRFQSLDFLGMMGITAAGIHSGKYFMANGANLAYPKRVFEAVGGFGEDRYASGDDMLLLERIRQQPNTRIVYLKHPGTTVLTQSAENWSAFFRQRLRWGTKTSGYQGNAMKWRLGVAWMFCWSIALNTLFGLFSSEFLWLALWQFGVKGIADAWLLWSTTDYFDRPDLRRGYVRSELWHFWYILTVGTASVFVRRYEWKGRRVR